MNYNYNGQGSETGVLNCAICCGGDQFNIILITIIDLYIQLDLCILIYLYGLDLH